MSNETDKGMRLLEMARECHGRLAPFRRERERNKRYNYGDQWGDTIDLGGRRVTEGEYIKEQGSVPLKNNLIRRLVRNVVGVYDNRATEPVCTTRDVADSHLGDAMTALLRHNGQVNRLSTLYTRSIEEFLISGMVVHRKSFGRRNGRIDCWTDFVQPNNFFVDANMRDFRGWDCSFVGEIHDVPFDQLATQLAHTGCEYHTLKRAYNVDNQLPQYRRATPLCRVYEIWVRETDVHYTCHDRGCGRVYRVGEDDFAERVAPEMSRRVAAGQAPITASWGVSQTWRYYFVDQTGRILSHGDTPYAHGGHPYVFKAYPMIDGEIHSFVGDVIDQQRYTNRLITLYDWIMRASAKGVLLVPEDCVPRGCSPSDFAEAWSRYNGVIYYKPSTTGNIPQQVSSNSTNIGIKELLDLQLKFFEDVSGVNSAIQGKPGNVGISAELYGQQTQNATTALLDILDTFTEFVKDCALMDVSNIRQFYDDDRIAHVIGASDADPMLRTVDYDVNIESGKSRRSDVQSSNAMLMEIWKTGQITLEQMLRAGQFPFANELLSSM